VSLLYGRCFSVGFIVVIVSAACRYIYVKDVVNGRSKKVFNELNLLFEAALIVLFYMEPARSVRKT
jgi:hypothetical protein